MPDAHGRAVREVVLEAARAARAVLADPAVAAAWDSPSALPRLSVGALAAHMSRAVVVVPEYLASSPPAAEPIPAEAYFAVVVTSSDLEAPLNVGVRERAEAAARQGHAAVLAAFDHGLELLRARLAAEPPDRKVAVLGGLVMQLDDYLVTRLVELVVHADDLALSTGLEAPLWPARVADLAIRHMVGVARRRHGDLAVLRALARRERDVVQALRVF